MKICGRCLTTCQNQPFRPLYLPKTYTAQGIQPTNNPRTHQPQGIQPYQQPQNQCHVYISDHPDQHAPHYSYTLATTHTRKPSYTRHTTFSTYTYHSHMHMYTHAKQYAPSPETLMAQGTQPLTKQNT